MMGVHKREYRYIHPSIVSGEELSAWAKPIG
jgi:hypothetical protein